MLKETLHRLGDAICQAAFHPATKSRPGLETDEYMDGGCGCFSAEIFPTAGNAPLFDELSQLCINVQKGTGTPAPEGSACRSLWIEYNSTTGTLSSSTHLHCGGWYISSEFGDIHESFSDALAEKVITAIRDVA